MNAQVSTEPVESSSKPMPTVSASAPPPQSPRPRSRIRTTLLFVGALLFLLEEWLWVAFLRLFGWLGRLGLLRWLDRRLVRLPPVAALCILCVPIALLFPIKIAGLWMIASGRFFGGCVVMLLAKVASTAIVARLFLTTRSQLLQMPWFARLYNVTCALRDRVHQWMAAQPAWQDAKRAVAALRHPLRAWRRARRRSREPGPAGVLRRWRRTRRRTAMAANVARAAGDGKPR
jgi:hypothetical protein